MRAWQELSDVEKIGQRLCVGFPGPRPTEELLRLIREYKVGNIVLFRHNIESGPQLAALCAELRALIVAETGIEPLISIDQEGGPVTRLPESEINLPGAMAVAATDDLQNAYSMGLITAQELRGFGIDLDLAPVLDVNCNPGNPVIGVRSYGDTPQQVAEYGTQMLGGLLAGGVLACCKHFPGHGDTAVDSHLGLPCIDRSLPELEARELLPFRAAIAAGAPCIMSAHILFPQLEPENRPATMSRAIMTDLLRGRLGFGGIIFSDCMEMQAIQTYYGTVPGTLAAMDAGVDCVFISQTPALALQAAQAAQEALQNGTLDRAQLDESVARILRVKALRETLPHADYGTQAQCRACIEAVRAASVTAVQLPGGALPPLGDDPLFIGCPDYRSTIASNAESSGFTFAEELHRLAGRGAALVTGKDPDADEIARAAAAAQGHSCLVLGTYNGHILRGQLRLAQALADTGRPLIVVSLRNPYDLADLPPHVAALAGWEYTRPLFAALWEVLDGRAAPRGHLPLRALQ